MTLPKNITRYDNRRVHGYLVRFKRRGKPLWKWILDSAHGGREGSRRAALLHWKRTVLALPVALQVARHSVKSKTGIVGVWLDWSRDKNGRKHYSYRASWPDATGRTLKPAFSVKKFGKAEARRLAAKARREGLRELQAAKRAALRREVRSTHTRS